jgi:type IV pilus assembly protein PilA
MKWYYAEGGRQIGPVEESVLDDLVRQGVVRDDTLVWQEGMAAWQRHAAVRGGSSPSPGNVSPPAPPSPYPAPAAAKASGGDVR